MTNGKMNHELLESVCAQLEEESLQLIDFDALRGMLIDLRVPVEEYHHCLDELRLIKAEYRRRVTGMWRTVLAGGPDEEAEAAIASLAADIDDLSAAALITMRQRVEARFRCSFPSSYEYRTTVGMTAFKDWEEHKI